MSMLAEYHGRNTAVPAIVREIVTPALTSFSDLSRAPSRQRFGILAIRKFAAGKTQKATFTPPCGPPETSRLFTLPFRLGLAYPGAISVGCSLMARLVERWSAMVDKGAQEGGHETL